MLFKKRLCQMCLLLDSRVMGGFFCSAATFCTYNLFYNEYLIHL